MCVKSTSKNEVFIGEIIGIVSSSHFSSCVSCGGKVEESGGIVGGCTKCTLKQKISRCKKNFVAQVMLANGEGVKKTVTMFSDMIEKVLATSNVEDSEDIETKLLCVNAKEYKLRPNNVVMSVEDVNNL